LIGFRSGGFALEDSGLRPQVKSSRERSRRVDGPHSFSWEREVG
jgi:hypothetical protein